MALLTNINGKFSVSDAGAVTFNNAFTFPTADGTANYVLQTDGNGQLNWAVNGDITGSGTANTVTKFTGAKTIGDGPITFSSNDSTFAGSVTVNLSAEGTYFTGGSGGVRQLSITSGTNISAHALHTFNIASSNGKYEFDVNGTTELSLDSSNATFAGSITGTSAEFIDTSNPGATSGSVIIEGRRDGSPNVLTLRAKDASAPADALPDGQGPVVRFQGFDGTDFENMGYIQVAADGQAVANGDAPGFMAFGTSADGSSSPTERMRIDSSGNSTFAGNVDLGDSSNISMSAGSAGQLQVKGSGYTGAIALRNSYVHLSQQFS
jgi:hypothetical protein